MTDLPHLKAGRRVGLAPHTDAWMQGDRYGTIVAVGWKYVHAKMDSGRTLSFLRDDSEWGASAINASWEP